MMVLALGIVGVLRGYAASITVLEAAQQNIDAVNLLKMKMGELELAMLEKEEIIPESGQGVFESPFEDVQWAWDVTPAAETEEQEGRYALALSVTSRTDPRMYTASTLLAEKKNDEEEQDEGAQEAP